MPLTETDTVDFNGRKWYVTKLYAGYKEETPKKPETPEETDRAGRETPSETVEGETDRNRKRSRIHQNEEEKEEKQY